MTTLSPLELFGGKIKALKYSQFRANLILVLKKSERFDFEAAKTAVTQYLSKLMILTDSEKLFIENFNPTCRLCEHNHHIYSVI